MRRALLALAFLALAAVARAQVDEITDVIYEINNPPTAGASHAMLSTTHSDSVVATPVLGDLIYFNGTGWARLGIGSSGQVVTVTAGIPAWADATGGGSGAPTDATYITETANGSLSAEFAMGSLGTGLVKNATTTGVPSIYAGTSCTNQFVRSLNASGAATCESIVNADITATTIDLTTKVTGLLPYANLANGTAISVLGRSANSSGVNAPIQCTAASDAVLRESGSALGCGTVATAGIANSAITLAKIANAAANKVVLASGASGSGAAYTEISAVGPNTTISNSPAGVARLGFDPRTQWNIFEEFGQPSTGITEVGGWLNWTVGTTNTPGNFVSTVGEANHPGAFSVVGNAGNNAVFILRSGTSFTGIVGGEVVECMVKLAFEPNNASGQGVHPTGKIGCGFNDSTTDFTTGTDSLTLFQDSAVSNFWLVRGRAAGSGSSTASNTAITVGWHRLTIYVESTSTVHFYVDGTELNVSPLTTGGGASIPGNSNLLGVELGVGQAGAEGAVTLATFDYVWAYGPISR